MLPFLICLLALFGAGSTLQSGNQYMDNVLHTTLQNIISNERLDPTFLPDYTFEYHDKTFVGKVNGKVEYSNGALSGLSQVARAADCAGPFNATGGTYINCTLSFHYLKTSHKGKVKYGVLPKISIDAKADVSTSLIEVSVVKALSSNTARIQSFLLRQIGQLTPNFSGLGPLNKHMKILERNYQSRVVADVTNVMMNRFQYALNLAVGQVPMPLR